MILDAKGNPIDLHQQLRDTAMEQIEKLRGNADVTQNDRQLSLQSWVKLGIEIIQMDHQGASKQADDEAPADLPVPGDKQVKSK